MMKIKLSLWLFFLCCLGAAPTFAGNRPVSLGLNANFDFWATRGTNVGWTRIDILWKDVEPQRGVFNWPGMDGQINEARANGLQILGILHVVPSWANGSSNTNMPPYSTTDWAEFVHQVSARYSGKIAAYEVWNEPDTNGSSEGIGWDRNVEEPPLYTDFVHAAAVQIRTYAPGTLVVGPAYRTFRDCSGCTADNRKRRIFQQLQAAVYPDGTGPSFLDVTSYHSNAKSTESSRDMALSLVFNNLNYLSSYLPSKAADPVWVTEFSWRSNAVGEAGQREKECNEAKFYTGYLDNQTGISNYNITRAFIWPQLASGYSQSVFYDLNTPKMVVTQYLRPLGYPATQQPSDFPNCSTGALVASTSSMSATLDSAFATWESLGLGDPRQGLPPGFGPANGEVSGNQRSAYLTFDGPGGAVIRLFAAPRDSKDVNQVWSEGAEWNVGPTHVSLELANGSVHSQGWVRALATSVDPAFQRTCLDEVGTADENTLRAMGVSAPKLPLGFVQIANRFEITRAAASCGTGRTPKIWDFMWTFKAPTGETLRAGTYRYGDSSPVTAKTPTSLHWSDARGRRYWVAVEATEVTPALEDALYSAARSMDPSLSR